MITTKNLCLILLLCLGALLPAAAQVTDNANRDLSTEDYERMIQAAFNVEFRKAAIEALEMTEAEITAFTPVYVQYMNSKVDLVDRRARLIDDYRDDLAEDDSAADKEEELAGMLENYWEIDNAESELRKDYFDRLEDLIPVDKAINFFLLEDAVSWQMQRAELGELMPSVMNIRLPDMSMQQNNMQQTPPTAAAADRDVSAEEYERMIENRFKVNFRTLAVETLELSPEQINAFTPLYMEYMDRQADLNDRRSRIFNNYREEMQEDDAAQEEAEETADLIENLWEVDIAGSEARKDLFDRLEDAIGVEKAMQFFLLDDALRGQLRRMALYEAVPGLAIITIPDMQGDQDMDQDQDMAQDQPRVQPSTPAPNTAQPQPRPVTTVDDWTLKFSGEEGLDHEYTSQGLRKIVGAIDAIARKGNVTISEWQTWRPAILRVADVITQDWRSLDHADRTGEAFLLIALTLEKMQQQQSFASVNRNMVSNLKSTAKRLNPDEWMTRQTSTVYAFFNQAAGVINAMADQVNLRSADVASDYSSR